MPSWAAGVGSPSDIGLPTSPNDQYWKPAGSASSSWPVVLSATGAIGP